MLISNGYIRVVIESAGDGFDENGNPVVGNEVLGEKIPCNFVRNRYRNNISDAGSENSSATYTILIEPQRFEPCQYRLYDLMNNEIGLFEVRQEGIVFLPAVGKLQISQ